jgi:hypothetical protein
VWRSGGSDAAASAQEAVLWCAGQLANRESRWPALQGSLRARPPVKRRAIERTRRRRAGGTLCVQHGKCAPVEGPRLDYQGATVTAWGRADGVAASVRGSSAPGHPALAPPWAQRDDTGVGSRGGVSARRRRPLEPQHAARSFRATLLCCLDGVCSAGAASCSLIAGVGCMTRPCPTGSRPKGVGAAAAAAQRFQIGRSPHPGAASHHASTATTRLCSQAHSRHSLLPR